MFQSVEELSQKLSETGYFIDPTVTKVVFLADQMKKPLLLEGPAGSGKTQLAISVAAAAGTHVERLQCYRGVSEEQAIGRFDESLQRLYMEYAKGQHGSWKDLQTSLKGRDFFRAGPLMRALEYDKPCVLLIDELDKVDEGFEAQAFKRGCSCFGLGRYFYDFEEQWVELDDYRRPKRTPQLIMPGRQQRPDEHAAERPKAAASSQPSSRLDGRLTGRIEGYKEELGEPLYQEVLTVFGKAQTARSLPSVEAAEKVLHLLERTLRGIEKARDLGGDLSVGEFDHVLHKQRIRSLNSIPTFKALTELVNALEAAHSQPRAA
jgi:AAA domain (dynein-related subfamily)